MKIKFILLLAFLLSSFSQAGEVIDASLDVEEGDVIDIEIVNGDISIRGWDEDQVQIVGELSESIDGFNFERKNGVITFEEETSFFQRNNCNGFVNCNGNSGRSHLEILVPLNSTLKFEGINIELDVQNLEGDNDIQIVNGSVIGKNLSGRTNLETINGAIKSTNLNGQIYLSTVNGSILDKDSSGDRISFNAVNGNIESNSRSTKVSATSINGRIELDLGEINELDASSVSGRIKSDLSLMASGQIDISSVSGRIELTFNNPNLSARFDLNTAVGGRITNRLSDHKATRKNQFINSSELRFSLNGGDSDVQISTVSGNITLNSK